MIYLIYLFMFIVSISWLAFTVNTTIYYYKRETTRRQLFDRYPIVLAIFNEAKVLSYDKVYREKLLAHTASGFRINNIEIEEMGREYVKHVFSCCGPKITDDLIEIHGDMDSICSLLLHGFVSKVLDTENQIMTDVVENDDYEVNSNISNMLLNTRQQ